MGKIYSAQNVVSYFIYELNDLHTFINAASIQHLLAEVELEWQKVYGHSAFSEKTYSLASEGYIVKEVYDAYKENEDNHITLPAKEWFLKFGEFQLVHRTYGIPNFTEEEEKRVKSILNKYLTTILKAS